MDNNENQFCNDCGMLISDCTCGAKNLPHLTAPRSRNRLPMLHLQPRR